MSTGPYTTLISAPQLHALLALHSSHQPCMVFDTSPAWCLIAALT